MQKKYFLLILIPVLLGFLYWGNIKSLKASRAGMQSQAKKVFNYNTFVNHEFRKALANQAMKSENIEFIWLAMEQIEKNIQERPLDAKSHILLTYLYYRLKQDDKALKTAEKLLKLAPNRPDVQELYKNIEQGEGL